MNAKKASPRVSKVSTSQVPPHPDPGDPDHEEWVIDEADEESFPASDPSAIAQPHPRRDKKNTSSR